MLKEFIIDHIRQQLPYEPNEGQEALLGEWGSFLTSQASDRLFILRGYAGTGKTSMVSALVKALHLLNRPTVLLAPTGRAAKVLSAYSQFPAYTIHKFIYRQKRLGESSFSVAPNTHPDTLFIVDEASMISAVSDNPLFGTGCLLDDLVHFVYSADHCSMILIGDDAQLPPVGQSDSRALSADYMQGYGLSVSSCTLTEVARQANHSGILFNATQIRQQLLQQQVFDMPHIVTDGFTDIRRLTGADALEALERSYREAGEDETIVLTRTNRRMNLYNQGIRSRILWKEELLNAGDRIMVTRNNYFFTEQYEGLEFLANGDMLCVQRVRKQRQMYGFTFADITLRSLDYDWEIDAIAWLDTLNTDSPDDNYQLQRTLFERISEDYPEIRSRKELVKTIMANPYFNALQIKHAYAVTCHKAQGGQWDNVFIDPGKVADEHLGEDFYRWYYTAITRAKKQVVIIG